MSDASPFDESIDALIAGALIVKRAEEGLSINDSLQDFSGNAPDKFIRQSARFFVTSLSQLLKQGGEFLTVVQITTADQCFYFLSIGICSPCIMVCAQADHI